MNFAFIGMWQNIFGNPRGKTRDWVIYHKAMSVFQVGFSNGKQTTVNVFVTKTTHKY
jgi:hypothetical protein